MKKPNVEHRPIERVPIDKLQETFHVRSRINPDRVVQFRRLYESGQQIPPLLITEDFEIIEGRHRKAALEQLERSFADCQVIPGLSEQEKIVMALASNCGGPLPATEQDIDHTISLLMNAGMKSKQIIDQLSGEVGFTRAYIRRHIDDVISKLYKQRMAEARAAVAEEDMSAKDAALKYGVDLDRLKDEIAGKKPGPKLGFDFAEIKGEIITRHKSTSSANAALVKKLFDQYDAGFITEKDVRLVLNQIGHQIKEQERSQADRVRRFEERVKLVRESNKSLEP